MSKLTRFLLFFSLISLINNQETNTEDNSNEKKSSTIWTTKELLKYTLKNHGKDNYFICDPLNYISSEEKEVIYYRLDDIYKKLNITVVFFVLDKISLEGLNITEYNDKDEFEEDEDDEIVYKSNKTLDKNNFTNGTNINNSLVKTPQQTEREFQIYIAEVKKKLFNRKIFAEKESKSLVGIFTVDDLGKYLYVGRDNRDMITKEEIDYLLQGKDHLIQQKNLYIAVDNLFSNFLYRYAPSKMDKFNKFMGFMGELLGIGAIIFSYYLMNKKKEEQPPQGNQNNNKKEEKKEDKNEEKKEEKKDNNKSNEKEKQD